MRIRTAIPVALLALVAGCGSGSATTGSGSTAKPSATLSVAPAIALDASAKTACAHIAKAAKEYSASKGKAFADFTQAVAAAEKSQAGGFAELADNIYAGATSDAAKKAAAHAGYALKSPVLLKLCKTAGYSAG